MRSRAWLRFIVVVAFCVLSGRAFAAAVGEMAPPFTLATAEGPTISLEGLRGKVVYLDFWASWCGPCRRSFPWMNEMQQRYGQTDVAIVAVNVDAKRADAEQFLRRYPASFVVVFDAAGATPRTYDVKAMPSSYLIDRKGRIARIEHGFLDEHRSTLEDSIRTLSGER